MFQLFIFYDNNLAHLACCRCSLVVEGTSDQLSMQTRWVWNSVSWCSDKQCTILEL